MDSVLKGRVDEWMDEVKAGRIDRWVVVEEGEGWINP